MRDDMDVQLDLVHYYKHTDGHSAKLLVHIHVTIVLWLQDNIYTRWYGMHVFDNLIRVVDSINIADYNYRRLGSLST